MAKKIHVRCVGIVTDEPYDGTLSILYVPDQDHILKAGKKYEIVLEGFSFAHKDTGAKHD